MPSGRTTIKELARISGVSVGTVSRALNGYADVSPATREKIMRLAQELEYTPAAAARTLVTQRSHVIGVFLETEEGRPDLQHPFFHEVLVGLKDEAGRQGFDLLLFSAESPGNGYGAHSYLKRCRHHHVDGVVLMGIDPDGPELQRLLKATLPTVGVDVQLEGTNTTYVTSDNVQGSREAVLHLAELGHRRIAHIGARLDTRPGRDRLKGYREALQTAGIAFRDEYVELGDFYVDTGREAAEKLLKLDERPTAIFCASDLMAMGAHNAIAEAGLSVPHDISLVGFDDIMFAAHLQPPLTTLRQDKGGLGAEAARALIALTDAEADAGPTGTTETTGALPATASTLSVDLIVRGSTAPPKH